MQIRAARRHGISAAKIQGIQIECECWLGSAALLIANNQLRCRFVQVKLVVYPQFKRVAYPQVKRVAYPLDLRCLLFETSSEDFNLLPLERSSRLEVLLLLRYRGL